MALTIITVDKQPGAWVNEAVTHYQKMIPKPMRFDYQVVATAKRLKTTSTKQCLKQEAQAIEALIPNKAYTIALEVNGQTHSSEQLAQKINHAYHSFQNLAFIIGGPDGLDPHLSKQCQQRWSLSPWTLSHGLARVVLAEQLFRAWSLLNNHPFSQH
jgi:23S rRNA (pseudouridine1915-N3)-methyltransferase